MTKKITAIFILFALLTGMLTGCAGGGTDTASGGGNDAEISIVCTIFPQYDWVKQILGGDAKNVELTLLVNNGVDLHSYQPTADDIIKISECDMFIYVGGESDAWVEDALKEAKNKDMIVIDLLDVLGDAVKNEEVKEGMEAEKDAEEPGYDEHVWLSLKNAVVFCGCIAEQLEALDAADAETYKTNAAAYIAELTALDMEYQSAVDSAKFDTLLFGDRFPFLYMADDYGLNYYAAFAGCSAETEASFATIAFLSGKVDELGLTAVLTIEGTDHKIAETIIANTLTKDQTILTMDSLQSVSKQEADGGTTYISVMRSNLSVLKEALN